MTNEEINSLRTLIGSQVLVITKTGKTLKGTWKSTQVNTITAQLRLVLETENSTITCLSKNIKSFEKRKTIK